MAGRKRKRKRSYTFTPDEWENVQNQIAATISLLEIHVLPDIPPAQAEMVRSYLRRMQAACKPRVMDSQQEVEVS